MMPGWSGTDTLTRSRVNIHRVRLRPTLVKALMPASSMATGAPDWFRSSLSWKILT